MKHLLLFVSLWMTVFSSGIASASSNESSPPSGEVTVSLDHYNALLEQNKQTAIKPSSRYTLGESVLSIDIKPNQNRLTAVIKAEVVVKVYENSWTQVDLLGHGATLSYAKYQREALQLQQTHHGYSWLIDKAGTYNIELEYQVDASYSPQGNILALPIPNAASTHLKAFIPYTDLEVAIAPSTHLRSTDNDGKTTLTAEVPSASNIMLSWKTATSREYSLSRAAYVGELINQALVWTATYEVTSFQNKEFELPILPDNMTLTNVTIDDKKATVINRDNYFNTLLSGAGKHKVTLSFQVPIAYQSGPPKATLPILKVPMSRFQLTLPGKKELKVSPNANISLKEHKGKTIADINIPMTDQVQFSWTEAIPEDVQVEARANASIYHSLYAEEGVLHGQAMIDYEVTHGETNIIKLAISKQAQVNKVTKDAGGISDWAVVTDEQGNKQINIFLDRKLKGKTIIWIDFEQLLGSKDKQQAITIPKLSANNVHRQRGMLALLASQELALKPISETLLSQVGENQLPASFRNQFKHPVAHTYKYTNDQALLSVKTVAPERKQGKFDAEVNTLISIGEVALKGSATVDIDVKSGTIMDLAITLPTAVNLLTLTGPSIRHYKIDNTKLKNQQTINIEFTQELEGQFKLQVNYEKIMQDKQSSSHVPALTILNAEVEHGKIAVEALTAVEVKATETKHLSSVDINELPQQLILKTSNPILLAYKYVHAKPSFQLGLEITRHQEIDVQSAVIEQANYKTLYTKDGLAVTTAELIIRNSRRQFLRMNLPQGSKVWSLFVDNKAEKPALAGEKTNEVLIKMIRDSAGFKVQLVYETPIENMEYMGNISGHLPTPDMLATNSHWQVYLPVGPSYHSITSTMDIVSENDWINQPQFLHEQKGQQQNQALKIDVPAQGIRFTFKKLYANQSDKESGFNIRYTSEDGSQLGLVLSVIGALLIWAGIIILGSRLQVHFAITIAIIGSGLISLLYAIGYLSASMQQPAMLSIIICGALFLFWLLRKIVQAINSRQT